MPQEDVAVPTQQNSNTNGNVGPGSGGGGGGGGGGAVEENNPGLAGVLGPVLVNRTRNNNNQNPLYHMRDRLFHAIFIKAALAYARAFPRPVRRFIEFIVLLKVSFLPSHFYYFQNFSEILRENGRFIRSNNFLVFINFASCSIF